MRTQYWWCSRRPWTTPVTHCREQMYGEKGTRGDTLWHHSFQSKFWFLILISLSSSGRLQAWRRMDTEGHKWYWSSCCEAYSESIQRGLNTDSRKWQASTCRWATDDRMILCFLLAFLRWGVSLCSSSLPGMQRELQPLAPWCWDCWCALPWPRLSCLLLTFFKRERKRKLCSSVHPVSKSVCLL